MDARRSQLLLPLEAGTVCLHEMGEMQNSVQYLSRVPHEVNIIHYVVTSLL